MASSDIVNYAIRPNKTIERKLIFETLSGLDSVYNFSGYKYIGLGALWFIDFIMAHKYLSISDMISIEKDEYLASRANFNRPYACVNVIPGESYIELPKMELEDSALLVWLDYDTSIDGPVLKDLSTLCQRALSGSILIVTINAHKNSLPDQDEEGRDFKDEEDRLRYFAGDLIPQELPKGAMQKSGYPRYLATLIFSHMRRQVRTAGREGDQVYPLFNIGYKDNAPMITVGAAIVDEERAEATATRLNERNIVSAMNDDNQLPINVPPLTLKEKARLDQLLPCDPAPSEHAVEALGFRLKPTQIAAYHSFYRYYPMFWEMAV